MPKVPVNAALGSCLPIVAISKAQIGIIPIRRHLHVSTARGQEAPAGKLSPITPEEANSISYRK